MSKLDKMGSDFALLGTTAVHSNGKQEGLGKETKVQKQGKIAEE